MRTQGRTRCEHGSPGKKAAQEITAPGLCKCIKGPLKESDWMGREIEQGEGGGNLACLFVIRACVDVHMPWV